MDMFIESQPVCLISAVEVVGGSQLSLTPPFSSERTATGGGSELSAATAADDAINNKRTPRTATHAALLPEENMSVPG
jgi:hypothetical protein